jgi:hypothetical protein
MTGRDTPHALPSAVGNLQINLLLQEATKCLYLALSEQKRKERSCPRRVEEDAAKFPEV